jgi:hypothetical protein
VDHHNLHPSTREVLVVHRNAPLPETGRLRLARCVVEDGWPLRRAAERFPVSHVTAARWAAGTGCKARRGPWIGRARQDHHGRPGVGVAANFPCR